MKQYGIEVSEWESIEFDDYYFELEDEKGTKIFVNKEEAKEFNKDVKGYLTKQPTEPEKVNWSKLALKKLKEDIQNKKYVKSWLTIFEY